MDQKTPNNLTLRDICVSIDSALCKMGEAADAMLLLQDVLEDEGFQAEDEFDETMAILFARRFPMHFSTYSLILRSFQSSIKELAEASDRAYDLCNAQKARAEA